VTGKICAFTGHRTVPSAELEPLRRRLAETVEQLWDMGYRVFCAGGALGFDRMAADAVLALRKKHPDVRLHLILPCEGQERPWGLVQRLAYHKQVKQADEVEVLAKSYYDGCMQVRNARLVELADHLVAYVTRTRSGAAQTLRMAERKGIGITNLAAGR
jgi:uncharacterized phage-like protein YoqJ